jgi:hypothetical protein
MLKELRAHSEKARKTCTSLLGSMINKVLRRCKQLLEDDTDCSAEAVLNQLPMLTR